MLVQQCAHKYDIESPLLADVAMPVKAVFARTEYDVPYYSKADIKQIIKAATTRFASCIVPD